MRKVIFCALLVIGSLGYSVAWAQCGYGVDAGGGNCVPGPGISGSPFNHYDDNSAPPPAPRAVWADRWGAIAMDETTGQTGTASNQPNRAKAERIALSGCAMYGSPHCKIALSYSNGCGAVAAGTVEGGGIALGSTQEEAESKATNLCSRYGSPCKINYSKCSLPVRIQ